MQLIENKNRVWGENDVYIYSYQHVPGKPGARHLVFTADEIGDALARAEKHSEDLPTVRPIRWPSLASCFIAGAAGAALGHFLLSIFGK